MRTCTVRIMIRVMGQYRPYTVTVTHWPTEPPCEDSPGDPGGCDIERLIAQPDGVDIDLDSLTDDEFDRLSEAVCRKLDSDAQRAEETYAAGRGETLEESGVLL